MTRILLLLPFALAAFAAPAQGVGIRRCTSPDGSVIHTDRDCASFGATDRLPPPASRNRAGAAAIATSKGVVSAGTRPECPASPDALVGALGAAWQSRDVNRVAGLVDWRGTGSGAAHRVLRELRSALRSQPLDIALEAPSVYELLPDPFGGPPSLEPRPAAEPTNVRVDRVDDAGWGQSLRFGLRQGLGCYWLVIASLD